MQKDERDFLELKSELEFLEHHGFRRIWFGPGMTGALIVDGAVRFSGIAWLKSYSSPPPMSSASS